MRFRNTDWRLLAVWLFNALLALFLYTLRSEVQAIHADVTHVRELAQAEIDALNLRINDHIGATKFSDNGRLP